VSRTDLLRLPFLGRFLRWRHARTTLQVTFLGLAVLIILDGLFGPQLAPRNLAGTLPWVHWRGFVVLSLLIAGNLFCMACPFMLPRRLAKRFGPAQLNWPAPLRTKWLAVALLILFFWAYEAFALWASPWLTAWVAVTYFALAFVIDGFFKGASFCKHVCPIGQFHFVNGMVSPTEVSVRDPAVCERCRTLDCIRGRYASPLQGPDGGWPGFGGPTSAREGGEPSPSRGPILLDGAAGVARLTPTAAEVDRPGDAASGRAMGNRGLIQGGCELALFQPRKVGNGDCTFCMECIHACPHQNVGIHLRSPLAELTRDPVRSGIGRLSRKPDWAALALLLTFGAYLNAFGMTEPVFALQAWIMEQPLTHALGLDSRQLLLALFFAVGLVVLPGLLTGLTALASRTLGGGSDSLVRRASTYAWALVPLGLGMWTAHYLFHLLVGGLTIVPVVQEYLRDLGLPAGEPRWGAGPLVPESWLLPIEIGALQIGLFLTLVVGFRIARREEGGRGRALGAFLPWAVLATLLSLAGVWLLAQPMEMRGTFQAL
jgi:polyferredoxin